MLAEWRAYAEIAHQQPPGSSCRQAGGCAPRPALDSTATGAGRGAKPRHGSLAAIAIGRPPRDLQQLSIPLSPCVQLRGISGVCAWIGSTAGVRPSRANVASDETPARAGGL